MLQGFWLFGGAGEEEVAPFFPVGKVFRCLTFG